MRGVPTMDPLGKRHSKKRNRLRGVHATTAQARAKRGAIYQARIAECCSMLRCGLWRLRRRTLARGGERRSKQIWIDALCGRASMRAQISAMMWVVT